MIKSLETYSLKTFAKKLVLYLLKNSVMNFELDIFEKYSLILLVNGRFEVDFFRLTIFSEKPMIGLNLKNNRIISTKRKNVVRMDNIAIIDL